MNVSGKYILDDETGEPVPCDDLMTWAVWMETHQRHEAEDFPAEGVRVSTIFLGLDYNWPGKKPPLIYETMIFGGEHDQYCMRYPTRADALIGHAGAVELVKGKAT